MPSSVLARISLRRTALSGPASAVRWTPSPPLLAMMSPRPRWCPDAVVRGAHVDLDAVRAVTGCGRPVGQHADVVADHHVALGGRLPQLDAVRAVGRDDVLVAGGGAADRVARSADGQDDAGVDVGSRGAGGVDADPVAGEHVVVAEAGLAVDLQAVVVEAVDDEAADLAVAGPEAEAGGRTRRQRAIELDDRVAGEVRLRGRIERDGVGDEAQERGRA